MNRKDWFTACSAVEKEALYRAELENYSEKLVVNGEGRIVFINEKYAAEFGKTPADIEGMTMAELFSRIKAPVILDIRDFDIPFIPHVDAVPGKSDGYIPIFIRSPLMDEKGAHVGDMIYDGQTWLRRYRGLYDKLNELVDEYQYLHAAKRSNTNARFVGSSTAVVQLKRAILLAAKTNATLLIEGETGTGKEVVANEVFSASARSGKRFVTLNCAAIPQELIESELFGYEEGAFTGARRGGKLGLFELANEGVILLDEINSLSLSAQAKLLRVLQERRVDRVGGDKSIPINVRVIAISNCPLEQMVAEGAFREDLYYRLNVLHIAVPPLRERTEDIPDLIRLFVQRCNLEMEKNVDQIDPKVYEYMQAQPWPGNVRQLQNWVERAMASTWKNVLMLSNFYWVDTRQPAVHLDSSPLKTGRQLPLPQMMDELERDIIASVLKQSGGNKKRAAEVLGISRQMLHRKIKQYQI